MINAESCAPGGENQGRNILDLGTGQVIDAHCYGPTKCLAPTSTRASVIGEYGYTKFLQAVEPYRALVKNPGVSGLVWTQLTDVEDECNGLMSYNRGKFNEDAKAGREANAR